MDHAILRLISFFWLEFVYRVLAVFVAWLPFSSMFYLIFMLISWYVVNPKSEVRMVAN